MKSPLICLLLSTLCISFSQPLCRDTERTLLLQLYGSFAIKKFASERSSAYPKTSSWGRSGGDCCVWDGVECDGGSGHVIGLDLSSSFLYGYIGANSSLFGLTHLQRLNLADNHFNGSRIPSSIGRLSKLTHLDLSRSVFSGQIPSEILSLSRLYSLDLYINYDKATESKLLQLKNRGLHDIAESLTRLKLLHLGFVDISAALPDSLADFSFLEYLGLRSTGLKGAIPHFQVIDVVPLLLCC